MSAIWAHILLHKVQTIPDVFLSCTFVNCSLEVPRNIILCGPKCTKYRACGCLHSIHHGVQSTIFLSRFKMTQWQMDVWQNICVLCSNLIEKTRTQTKVNTPTGWFLERVKAKTRWVNKLDRWNYHWPIHSLSLLPLKIVMIGYKSIIWDVIADGGYSDNLPILDGHTVTVSPFCGSSDICPQDETMFSSLQVTILNPLILMFNENCSKYWRLLNILFIVWQIINKFLMSGKSEYQVSVTKTVRKISTRASMSKKFCIVMQPQKRQKSLSDWPRKQCAI